MQFEDKALKGWYIFLLHSSVSLRGGDCGELLPDSLVMLDVLYSYEHFTFSEQVIQRI